MHASGMPWTLPLGLDSGVFMSAWASSQIRPALCSRSRKKCETPLTVPTATEWSPPRTTGTPPPESVSATRRASRWQVAAIWGRYFARGCPSGAASACSTGTFPRSSTTYPRDARRALRLATRIADGPISTPRRPWPRSRGAPMIAMWERGIIRVRIPFDAETQRRRENLDFCSQRLCVSASNGEPLELRIPRCPRERDYVADVFHAGEVHQHALEAHAETRVLD